MNAGQNLSIASLLIQLGTTVLVLAMIAAAAILTVRFVKPRFKFATGFGVENDRIRVAGKISLEPGKRIYLIEVDGRSMVVGVCANHMILLSDGGDCGLETSSEGTANAG